MKGQRDDDRIYMTERDGINRQRTEEIRWMDNKQIKR